MQATTTTTQRVLSQSKDAKDQKSCKMDTKTDTSLSWSTPPVDPFRQMADFIPDVKSQSCLSRVNKYYSKLLPTTTFSFFSRHYHSPDKNKIPPMLALEKMTASHVRTGNQLVMSALQAMKRGNLKTADTLIYKAMHRYGSAHAMRFVNMISGLPGRITPLSSDMEKLIEVYTKQAHQVLEKECTSNLDEKRHSNMMQELYSAQQQLKYIVEHHVEAYRYAYCKRYSNGAFDSSLRKSSSELLDCRFSPVTDKQLDTFGFLGSAPSVCGSHAWYLHTKSHQTFMEMEKSIDTCAKELFHQTEPVKKLFM